MWKKGLVFVTLTVASVLAMAHEFWLEPDRFYFNAGETARVHFRVGTDFIGEPWKAQTDRFQRLEHHAGNQAFDLKNLIKGETSDPFEIRLASEGTHLLVMETKRAFVKMDGENFTQYLREQGLDNIYYDREKNKVSADSATEYYSRYSKLILQAGTHGDETYKKVCNLPIEIIPDKNPSDMKKGDPVKFMIVYQGKPLFGAKVKVWNRYNHRTTVQNIYSQQDGFIETHVSNPGAWMISVVNMVPSKDPNVRYRSFWGTLVFGVR